MPENATIIPELTVIEQLSLMAYLRGSKPIKTDLQSLINLCRLHKVENKRTAQLSLGYKQRLNLAQALLNQPLVLIMDEPLNGLDPHLIIEFRNIIRKLKKKTLILISTHYLAEAEIISDRVLIMQNGLMLDNIELNQSAFDLEQTYMQHTANNEQSL
jgi:ABC-2 type transport system ATP-binding protein